MENFKNPHEKYAFERNYKLFMSYMRNIKKDLKSHITRDDFNEKKLRWEVLIDNGIFFDLIVSNVKSGIEIKIICSSRKFKATFITYDTNIGKKILPILDSIKKIEAYPED